MKQDLKLTMVIEKGEQGWLIGQIVEIPGVLTQGKTVEETRDNILDALNLYLEAQRGDRGASSAADEVTREVLVIH